MGFGLLVAVLVVVACTESSVATPLPLPKADSTVVAGVTTTPTAPLTSDIVTTPDSSSTSTADFEATVESERAADVSDRLATAVAGLVLPTVGPEPTASATPFPRPTVTASQSPIPDPTQTPMPLPTATPTPTPLPPPTATPTPAQTPTTTPTVTPTASPVPPSPTATHSPTPTPTPTPLPTATPTTTPTPSITPTPTATPRTVVIAGTFKFGNSGDTSAEVLSECGTLGDFGKGKKYSNDGSWFGVNGAAMCGTDTDDVFYRLLGFLGIELQATRFPDKGIEGCVMEITGHHGTLISSLPGSPPTIATYVVTATTYSADRRTVLLTVKESSGTAPSKILDYKLTGVCAG